MDRLIKLGVSAIKISSGSMTNFPLISYAAKKSNYGLEPKYYKKILSRKSLKKIPKNMPIKKKLVNW